MFLRIAATLIVIAMPLVASAATIEVTPIGSGDLSLVTVQGEFEYGDIELFRTKTSMLSKAVVLLGSDGGNLAAGIEIGKMIRLKGYLSFVPDGVRCASACALAWLGGSKRLMGRTALIGFHAAYAPKDGVNVETSVGNALVGAYLNTIGLPDRAVAYITVAAPNEITWLNLSDAAQIGVDVELFPHPENIEQSSRTMPDSWRSSTPDAPGPSSPDDGIGATTPPSKPLRPLFEIGPDEIGPDNAQAPATAPSTSSRRSEPFDLSTIPRRTLDLLDRTDASLVQARLKTLGYLRYEPDGIWGAGSRAALRDFRRTRSLGTDDRWDAETQSALTADDAPRAGDRPVTLPVGAETRYPPPPDARRNPLNRADALWLQSRLRELGFYSGDGDGTWGLESRSALQEFKQRNGLSPDETWDATTERKLSAAAPVPSALHHGRQ
jgi:peptidoglycan hydrolase-like protein with peptidoglycan-binding domain